METDRWALGTSLAVTGMSRVGASERRRHAGEFAEWCRARGTEPLEASCDDVALFAHAGAGTGDQVSKLRCSLRAVMSAIDPERSARVLGLGNQAGVLVGIDSRVAQLVEATVALDPGRRAVRLSALRRLFAWANEVDAAPESLSSVDLPQFRAWLLEVGAHVGETMCVARDFIELRRSPVGAGLWPEPTRASTRLEFGAPLRPRF